jgi:outer membrane protein
MKNGLVVLNLILLVAVAVLFYLHFSSGKKNTTTAKDPEQKDTSVNFSSNSCKIAYFEMDSVESGFEMAKEMQNELEKREDKINVEMGRLQNLYQQKFGTLQQHGSSMTNDQVNAAKTELLQLEQKMRDTKASMDQEAQSFYVEKKQEILSMIRKFCTEYNRDKKYAIIISNEPGLVFYKDSTLDITGDLLRGLNEMYGKKKTNKKD